MASRPEVGMASPQVLDGRGRIAFSGYGCVNGNVFIRNAGVRPECCDPLQLETSVHQVARCSSLCVMLRREIWNDGQVIHEAPGVRCLVSPFARAHCEAWQERMTTQFQDGTLIGMPPQRR